MKFRKNLSLNLKIEILEERRMLSTIIALIDSGVDLNSQSDSPFYDFTSAYDSFNKSTVSSNHLNVQDQSLAHGHGSTVADLIVQGILDSRSQTGAGSVDVKIIPIRSWSNSTSPGGSVVDVNAYVRGVYWAVDHGASIINISIANANIDLYDNDPSDSSFLGHNLYYSSLSSAISYAQDNSVIVVTAAGNNSKNIDVANYFIMPAASDDMQYNGLSKNLSNLLVAASVDASGNLTPKSNWGQTHVDLGAPSNYEGLTSYSAGYASGVSGVIAALTPNKTAAQRLNIINSSVQVKSQYVGSWSTTGGIISSTAAVAAAIATNSTGQNSNGVKIAVVPPGGPVPPGFVTDTPFVTGGTIAPASTQTITTTGVLNPAPTAGPAHGVCNSLPGNDLGFSVRLNTTPKLLLCKGLQFRCAGPGSDGGVSE